jgi:hypothetical protein
MATRPWVCTGFIVFDIVANIRTHCLTKLYSKSLPIDAEKLDSLIPEGASMNVIARKVATSTAC